LQRLGPTPEHRCGFAPVAAALQQHQLPAMRQRGHADTKLDAHTQAAMMVAQPGAAQRGVE
ncbi:MAG: hypothetical protein Q4A11_00450, partial [Brachymonas sp.]|nr:hypothetical protein [Brachymonas sp.]